MWAHPAHPFQVAALPVSMIPVFFKTPHKFGGICTPEWPAGEGQAKGTLRATRSGRAAAACENAARGIKVTPPVQVRGGGSGRGLIGDAIQGSTDIYPRDHRKRARAAAAKKVSKTAQKERERLECCQAAVRKTAEDLKWRLQHSSEAKVRFLLIHAERARLKVMRWA